MYDLPQFSLLPHMNPPLQEKINFSSVPIAKLGDVIAAFENTRSTRPHPETDVLKFYFLNHAFHVISSKYNAIEDLPEDIAKLVSARTEITTNIAKRVLCHTFLTLLYEMNWLHSGVKGDAFYQSIKDRFGEQVADHVNQVNSKHSGYGFILGKMAGYEKLNTTCGEYCRALFATYTSSPHFSAIAKDKQWIAIASVPNDFFQGYSSLEETCDKAFSLFHWGGSIFNKDIFYKVNSDTMLHLLDVQDSGQIPLWLEKNKDSKFVDKELKSLVNIFAKHFPEEVSGNISTAKISEAQIKRTNKLNNIVNQRGANITANNPRQSKDKAPPMQKIDEIVFGSMFGKP